MARVKRWVPFAVAALLALWFFGGGDEGAKLLRRETVDVVATPPAAGAAPKPKSGAPSVPVAPPAPPAAPQSENFNLPPLEQWPDVELWASGTSYSSRSLADRLTTELGGDTMKQLEELCGRCLFHTLLEGRTQVFGMGSSAFVATGDIFDEWLRDGAVQLGVFLPRLANIPGLRNLVDIAIKTQAYYLLQDPWANSFSQQWRQEKDFPNAKDLELGRFGFVSTRNYEPDTGAYYLNLLYNYYMTQPTIWARERFLNDTLIHDAVVAILRTYRIEQNHEKLSPYRYAELANNGLGESVGYTGMIWGGFRPSDDKQVHHYNIPVNMYVCAALEKTVLLNALIWGDPEIDALAGEMAEQIRTGIETHGRVDTDDGKIYAYEVNGLGDSLHDFDDPNVPSLMSVPILGYKHYDEQTYLRTKKRLLSESNQYYFETNYDAAKRSYPNREKIPFFGGLGSPHTPKGNIWPLGTMVEAILDTDVTSRADAFRLLLEMQCGNGLMHESVNVDNVASCTRPIFEWANTMYVVLFETSFGKSCEEAFEKHRLAELGNEMRKRGANADGIFYGTLMSRVKHWSGDTVDYQKIRDTVGNQVRAEVEKKERERDQKEEQRRRQEEEARKKREEEERKKREAAEKAAAEKAAAEKAAAEKAAAEKAAAEKAAAEKVAAEKASAEQATANTAPTTPQTNPPAPGGQVPLPNAGAPAEPAGRPTRPGKRKSRLRKPGNTPPGDQPPPIPGGAPPGGIPTGDQPTQPPEDAPSDEGVPPEP